MRKAGGVGVMLAVAAGIAGVAAGLAGAAAGQQPAAQLSRQEKVIQALDRLSWGITPGEVQQVEQTGLRKWIDEQLHPDLLPENPVLTAALAPLKTLTMSPAEVIASYPPGAAILQMARGLRPLPQDERLRRVVEAEIEVLRQRQQSAARGARAGRGRGNAAEADEPVVMGAPALSSFLTAEQVEAIESGNPRQRVAALENLPRATRDRALESLPRGEARRLAVWLPLDQERRIAFWLMPQQVVALDLDGAKVLRAVYTTRQLQDVLTDFWVNHFNIYVNKGPDREYLEAYEREAIRPYVLGKFKDLLTATAETPAMMYYLDNWQSVRAGFRGRGINENYGRELMELQTLGVNGGYTQKDVDEVARCFTGWTIRGPLRQASFFFNPRLHDRGAKVVLGHKIAAGGGMSDGLKVLAILAASPATAHHISYELAQRFVADDPPAALVDAMAATYMNTDGDLRQVMETMIGSPEFWSPQYYRDKVKSPLEAVVSSVRALGADVSNPTRLAQIIAAMGEPLYGKQPPTGYLNTGDAWASTSGLVARMNFARQLAANAIPGVQVDLTQFQPGTGTLPEVERSLFAGLLEDHAGPGTTAAIEKAMAAAPARARTAAATPAEMFSLAALMLASPDFQEK
jgi:uncharacterized protein (DUF1800 family)